MAKIPGETQARKTRLTPEQLFFEVAQADFQVDIPDDYVISVLDSYAGRFEAGDRLAIWDALHVCAYTQAVLPDWLCDAVVETTSELSSGKFDSFDDALGREKKHKNARHKNHKKAAKRSEVFAALNEHMRQEKTLNKDEGLVPLAQELGVSLPILTEIKSEEAEGLREMRAHWNDKPLEQHTAWHPAITVAKRKRGRPPF